jgi:hypothetical protein
VDGSDSGPFPMTASLLAMLTFLQQTILIFEISMSFLDPRARHDCSCGPVHNRVMTPEMTRVMTNRARNADSGAAYPERNIASFVTKHQQNISAVVISTSEL